MAAIDELIEQIDNPVLREQIAAEVQRGVKQKKFGLVFEEHLPEMKNTCRKGHYYMKCL